MNFPPTASCVVVDEPSQTLATCQADGKRRLLGALTVSLALHALLFVLGTPPRVGSSAAPTLGSRLAVRLSAPARSAMPVSPLNLGEPSDRVPTPAVSPQQPRHRATASSPGMPNVVEPMTKAAAPSFFARHEVEPRAEVQPKVSPIGTPSARGDDPAAKLEEAEFAVDDGLRGYRLALAHEARRQRQALRQAVSLAEARNGKGEPVCLPPPCVVGLRLMLGDAAERQVILAQSSGWPALDAQALWIMRQAAAATPVPESLRGRRLAIELWIELAAPAP